MHYLRRLQLARLMPFYEADGGAAGGAGAEGAGSNSGAEGGAAGGEPGAAGSQPDFGELLKNKDFQSEFDRRVTKALETAKGKWESEYQQKLEQEKSEAARLARLSAEERAKEEFKKEQEKFKLEKGSFERERMELETTKLLAAEKLPVKFAKVLMADTAENTKANVEAFKTAFSAAIEAAVTDRLKGSPPKAGSGTEGAQDAALRRAMGLASQQK